MEKSSLQELVEEGFTQRRIASHFGVSQSTVKYYLTKYGLKTASVRRFKYSDEDIIKVANESESFSETCFKITGLRGGNSYQHLRKRFQDLGYFLDSSVLSGQSKGGLKSSELRANKRAVLTATRLRRDVLHSLLKRKGVVEECGECGLTHWRGKKLKLPIHHRDGNRLNNEDSNLQYLCPNCHSLEH